MVKGVPTGLWGIQLVSAGEAADTSWIVLTVPCRAT